MRSKQSGSNNLDPAFTCGQMSTVIASIIFIIVVYSIIDLIIATTGWIALFFEISILVLLHSISMGIYLIIKPIKLKSHSSSLQESLKVNIIDHISFSVVFGVYFLFTASLFLKLLYLLSGGFSHVTSNYWDWLSYALYSAIDQISFGLVSTLLSILHVTFTSIQPTQTGQKIAVYLSTLVFALLFWASFLKFCKMLKKNNLQDTKGRKPFPDPDRLSNRFALVISFTSFIVLIIDTIIVGSFEWLVSFTGRAELGLIPSAIILSILIFTLTTLIWPFDNFREKVLSDPALSHLSTREKFFLVCFEALTLISSYLIFTAFFFQSLSLLSGGFSHAASNYWDWFSYTLYSAIDQISFNALSIFQLYKEPILATQTIQQIMVFILINFVFAYLIGKSLAKFYWPKIILEQKQHEMEKEITDVE